jgi:hypothetical protein
MSSELRVVSSELSAVSLITKLKEPVDCDGWANACLLARAGASGKAEQSASPGHSNPEATLNLAGQLGADKAVKAYPVLRGLDAEFPMHQWGYADGKFA